MINVEQLKSDVEKYLNHELLNINLNLDVNNPYEKFKLYTVKRLINSYKLFLKNSIYKEDFLLSLRNYMITFETEVSLESGIIDQNNEIGIYFDSTLGKYHAPLILPEYINSNFVQKVFQLNKLDEDRDQIHHKLFTDPFIYKITGFNKFKSLAQKLAVYGALNTPDGYTTLVSLPTGGGKSLITQTLSYQKDGLTIVIVPTVSLAIDQERVAKKYIKTNNNEEEIFYYCSDVDAAPIKQAITKQKAKLLFISPEALMNKNFEDTIKEANKQRYLKNIVIDEAHIVVDWGASFRVEYQCLESWRKKMMITNPSIRTILLSATFEKRTVEILKDFFSENGKWIEVRCDALRHEPHYMLVKAKNNTDKRNKMLEMIRKLPHPIIVYVARPVEAEELKTFLSENGINNVKTFTGLTIGAKRKQLIEEWVDDKYEIMIATSAFGVGVDKSDVRTVLHMYMPQNANAYYQELGRGGRDRLPCLSVMCITNNDFQTTFNRISKKVMTTEKIIGRWNSMYNNNLSKRDGNISYIDTSIKPNYNSAADDVDDIPTSDADKNWNIHVLLLLRRFGLINIKEVLVEYDKYTFIIEVKEPALLTEDENQVKLIEKIREQEWNYYLEAYNTLKKSVNKGASECWSQMFYDTYDKISEYCAGCNNHDEVVDGDFLEFCLKMPIKEPVHELQSDQLSYFGSANNIIIPVDCENITSTINWLFKQRISVIIIDNKINEKCLFNSNVFDKNVMILEFDEVKKLLQKKGYYYISGIVAIAYDGTPKEIYNKLNYVLSNMGNNPDIKVVHLIYEDTYFDWIGKTFTDIVDGPVINYFNE